MHPSLTFGNFWPGCFFPWCWLGKIAPV